MFSTLPIDIIYQIVFYIGFNKNLILNKKLYKIFTEEFLYKIYYLKYFNIDKNLYGKFDEVFCKKAIAYNHLNCRVCNKLVPFRHYIIVCDCTPRCLRYHFKCLNKTLFINFINCPICKKLVTYFEGSYVS